ncbi:MAG: hypothetical protein ISS71_09380 [Phycisphaerae bacterium]|nr:hypothetical protein [Phycisphaerae bacterium]
MKDVIERLRLEKVEFLKESYDIGYKEGLDYFREIPYGVLTIIDQYRDGPQQAAWECCEKFDLDFLCGGIFGEGITSIFEAEALKEKFGRPDIDDDLYAKGFFKALVDCYDKIKDQL